jgi:hypothetical protein
MRLSYSLQIRFNTFVSMLEHASLMRYFRWSTLCIFAWYFVAFKCPHKWGLEALDATPREHGNQTNDLETVDLTNGTHRYQYS